MYLTSAVAVVLVVVQVGGLGGQSGAEAVLLVDAEEDRSSFQHHILHPVGHRGLQVLLVHETHNQHSLCQADHQEGHANHKVYTCKNGNGLKMNVGVDLWCCCHVWRMFALHCLMHTGLVTTPQKHWNQCLSLSALSEHVMPSTISPCMLDLQSNCCSILFRALLTS